MLFHVEMKVSIPRDFDPEIAEDLKRTEKVRAQDLQRQGKWRHLWRVAGHYANVSIFDVESHDELHAILMALPLFPFMEICITPLCRHPSSIHDGDQ